MRSARPTRVVLDASIMVGNCVGEQEAAELGHAALEILHAGSAVDPGILLAEVARPRGQGADRKGVDDTGSGWLWTLLVSPTRVREHLSYGRFQLQKGAALDHTVGRSPMTQRRLRSTSSRKRADVALDCVLASPPDLCSAALRLNENWKRTKGSRAGAIDMIDMFSGCGGMSTGFMSVNGERPSFRLAGAVDIDAVANRTYELNLGVKPLHIDIRELARKPKLLAGTIAAVRHNLSRPLVLIGCAPCQGFSSHRNEAGAADPRNSLFVDFARIAAKLRPAAIVVENVPELLTDKYWPFVIRAREVLERAGYFVHVGVHNMAEFGVPQERFRALMLAMPKKFKSPRGFLNRAGFRTVRDAIGRLPPLKAGERHPMDAMHFTAGHRESTIATIRAVPLDGGSRPNDVGPECLRRAKERNGRAVFEDVYGRLFWDRPAITITAYARNPASGRYVHPEQHRGLSVREAALLQSFPDDYEFTGSLDERFRQIGNAVPPAFAAHLAEHILRELSSHEEAADFDRGITAPVGPSFSRLIPSLKAGHRRDFVTCDA